MKKNMKLRAIINGLIVALPFIVSGIVFTQKSVWFPILAYTLAVLSIFISVGDMKNEKRGYQKQINNKKFHNSDFSSSFLLIMLGMFVSMLCLALEFRYEDRPFLLIVSVVVFICWLLYVVIKVSDYNYTGYKIVKIKIAECDIWGTGTRENQWEFESMIYGDINSDENISIIRNNFKTREKEIIEEVGKKEEEDKMLEEREKKEYIDDYENDPMYDFKQRHLSYDL